MIVQITRKGKFTPRRFASNQCGATGETTFFYKVIITGTSNKLNPLGFIIDNNDIQDYFNSNWTKLQFPSCEQACVIACKDLMAKVFSGGSVALVVEVSIGLSDKAFATAKKELRP